MKSRRDTARGGAAGESLENLTAQSIRGSKRLYENRVPRDSSVTSQSPVESRLGMTAIVSPMRPAASESVATPRSERSLHVPLGPSVTRREGIARVESTGQSLGVSQPYGPHSSTMIAERSRCASGGDGRRKLPTTGGATGRLIAASVSTPAVVRTFRIVRLPLKSLPLIR